MDTNEEPELLDNEGEPIVVTSSAPAEPVQLSLFIDDCTVSVKLEV